MKTCVDCGGYEVILYANASGAKSKLNIFLKKLHLEKDYDVTKIIKNNKIVNVDLEKITKGGGYPDFKSEGVEEKGPGQDYISVTQWARAILEYRSGRRYRVAWRFTRTKSKLFKDVFTFYNWQLLMGRREAQ